jgi:hypothetical protein
MNDRYRKNNKGQKKTLCYQNGRLYFTKQAERSFYFILTLVMLVAGVLYKSGIL